MPVTNFDPAKHGFRFANSFVNNIVTLPGGSTISTRGRCGGMAFAALDYYFANLPVPTNATLPPDGTLLADYIYKRLLDSFVQQNGLTFVSWTIAADHPTWFSAGVTHWTKVDQTANLRQAIGNGATGKPVALGLVEATNLGNIGNNHQVVAYGYDPDPNTMPVFIYDNNHPGQRVTLSTDPSNPHYNASSGEIWRGFFVEYYSPVVPDYLIDGTLLQEASDPKVYVVYGGAKFWIPSPDAFTALGFSWGNIRKVGAGSMAYIADVPADGTLLKEMSSAPVYVMQGGSRHWITSPADFVAHGFSWDRVRTVPDGSLAAIPDGGPLPPIPIPAPTGTLKITVQPASIAFGSPVSVTVTAVDSQSGHAVPGATVHVRNFDASGKAVAPVQFAAGSPFTLTFHEGHVKTFDPETRTWTVEDTDPSGSVSAPYYATADVPFVFTPAAVPVG